MNQTEKLVEALEKIQKLTHYYPKDPKGTFYEIARVSSEALEGHSINKEEDCCGRCDSINDICRFSQKDGWISVEERLPEDWIRVLICCKELKQIQVTGYCWNKVWNLPNFIRKGTVTHWQTLPTPPQTKTK